jgi:DNA-binding IclR family transcriptional regulator
MKSINKAFDILELLLNNPDTEFQLSDICEATGLNKSTANRITGILVKRGYVSQKEKRGKYTLSTRFLTSSKQIRQSKRIKEVANPYLLKLGRSVHESVALAVRDGIYAYIIDAVTSQNILTTLVAVGSKLPLYCTSVGKLFMAHMSPPELEHYLSNIELQQFTAHTITDINILKASLETICKEGVAYDNEEQWNGIGSVAVEVPDGENNIIAAVSVVVPSIRLTREGTSEMLPHIKTCAEEISQAVGSYS